MSPISNRSSGELSDLAYNHKQTNIQHHEGYIDTIDELTYDKTDTEMMYDKTDTEMIYDKTDTEMIYDKTDTEMIYDKTDTEVVYDNKTDASFRIGSGPVFDGTDTEATLETDISFHSDKEGIRKKKGKGRDLLNNRAKRNSGNYSDSFQLPDSAKEPRAIDTDSERSLRAAKPNIGVRDSAEASSIHGALMRPRGRSVGYETDEIGRTEDDFSIASFAVESESHESIQYPESEGENKNRITPSSVALENTDEGRNAVGKSVEDKTEEDFSFASFDASSVEEYSEVGDANELNGMYLLCVFHKFKFISLCPPPPPIFVCFYYVFLFNSISRLL